MPSTVSTMARPGNTDVHHTPDVTSGSALLRSYPHSDAEVGSMPNPRNPSPARVRIASEELSVKISGSVRVALRKMCLEMIRAFEAPRTIADSTKGSALSRRVSARTTRKYCGMKTTVIENAAAAMPPHALDCPPEIAIDMTSASSRVGNA